MITLVMNMEMPNRKQNRLEAFDYGQEGAYFVTLCTQNRARIFQMELPVGNGKRHDTQVVPYGAIPGICITKRERHIGRSLHLCLVGNGLRAIPILCRRI